jgi:hypothetical protein
MDCFSIATGVCGVVIGIPGELEYCNFCNYILGRRVPRLRDAEMPLHIILPVDPQLIRQLLPLAIATKCRLWTIYARRRLCSIFTTPDQ